MPISIAVRLTVAAALCAAKGVLFRDPVNSWPACRHVRTPPSGSVTVIIVLLKLACTYTRPRGTFLRSRRAVRPLAVLRPISCIPPAACYFFSMERFLPATARLGPRRVRAFVLVR